MKIFTMNTCRHYLLQLYAISFVMLFMQPVAQASEYLWGALKEGGKVVLMRHAPVEHGPEAGDPLFRDPSCKRERNLSPEGRRKAEYVGKIFLEHDVPVSGIFHSPFCRTTETTQLIFGMGAPAGYLSLLEVLEAEAAKQQTERLSQVIGSHSGDGNLVLVTHEPNINAVSFEMIGHLDLLILDPEGDDEFEELGVIRISMP